MVHASTGTVEKPTMARTRRITFYIFVGLTLAAMAAYPPILIGPIVAWLDESVIDSLFGEEGLGAHRVHIEGATLLFWLTIVAMVSQFRRPETKAAPLWAAAVAWLVFLPIELTHLVDPFTIIVTALVVSLLALHPRRWPKGGFAWLTTPRAIAIIGTAFAGIYSFQQTLLQINGLREDPHVTGSHYALMAVLAIGLAVSALLGATTFPGHQISSWTVGVITVVLGVFFIGHPDQASSPGVGWGVVMIMWAVVYLWATARVQSPVPKRNHEEGQ